MADNELKFRITGDNKDATKALAETAVAADKVEGELEEVGDAGRKAGRQTTDALEDIKTEADRSASLIGSLGRALLTLEGARRASQAVGAIARSGREFEALRASLEFTEGSAEAAAAQLENLTQFAADPSIRQNLGEVTDAYIRLKNLGLDPTREAITAYLNVAAANRGKNLTDVIEAVADASVGEFERLKEFGIKAGVEGDKVVLRFRGQRVEIENNATAIQGALQQIGNVEFAGALEAQLDTTDAAINRLGTAFGTLSASLDQATGFNAALGALSNGLAVVVETLAQVPGSTAEAEEATSSWADDLEGKLEFLSSEIRSFFDLPPSSYEFFPTLEGEQWLEQAISYRDRLLADLERLGQTSSPELVELERQMAGVRKELENAASAAQKATGAIEGAADAGLDEALKRLGTDLEEVNTGLSRTEREAIEAFDSIVSHPAISGQAISRALERSLTRVSRTAAPALEQSLRRAFAEGQISEQELAEALAQLEGAYDSLALRAEDSARRQVAAAESVSAGWGDALDLAERIEARGAALEAFRGGLISAQELGEIDRSIDEEARRERQERRLAAQQAEAQGPPPLRSDWQRGTSGGRAQGTGTDWQPAGGAGWQEEADRGRRQMERTFAARPVQIPVEFTSVGGDLDDAALMRGA